jgi:DNA-binding transcriptional LysR family regulator
VDRLDAMATLLAAVEGGSLSAASRTLEMPLATVSRKVSDLEAHLRTKLVHRGSRRLTLTEAGRSYVTSAKRILEDLDTIERTAAGEYTAPRGDLVVTAPIVFGRLHVLPVALEFLAAYPEIDLRLVLVDHVVDLNDGDIDVAVRIGELPDSSLVAKRVGSIKRVVCASPDYLVRRGVPETPDQVGRHDCISFGGLTSPKIWTFVVDGAPKEVAVRSRMVVNTAEAAIDAAVASLGITRVLSYQVERALRERSLSLVLRDFEPAPSPVSLVHAERGLLALKVRAFLEFVGPRLKQRLAGIDIGVSDGASPG